MFKLLLRSVLITPPIGALTLWVVGISYEFVARGYKFNSGGNASESVLFGFIAIVFAYVLGALPAAFGAVYLFYMRRFGFKNLAISLILLLASFTLAMVYALFIDDSKNQSLSFLMIAFVISVPGVVFINFEQSIFNSESRS